VLDELIRKAISFTVILEGVLERKYCGGGVILLLTVVLIKVLMSLY